MELKKNLIYYTLSDFFKQFEVSIFIIAIDKIVIKMY